jgi:hypothetical protein
MKLSIVIPVLDSHEIVRRQRIYWKRLLVMGGAEVILVDDGSDPPIEDAQIYTTDKSAWTEHMATNLAVEMARGEYIFKTDIDHILSIEAISEALKLDEDILLRFKRKEAKLDDRGQVVEIGRERKPHSNTHVLKKSTFEKIGGYNEYGRGVGCGGSYDFRCRLGLHGIKEVMSENYVYAWPNSPITPTEDQHLFHSLRKTL